MILTVDVSNSLVQFGFCDKDGTVGKLYRIAADNRQTEYDYADKLKSMLGFAGISCDEIEGAVVSCVVPSLIKVIRESISIATGKEPLMVGSGVKTGIRIAVDDPGSVGSDLVALAVGAKENYPLPCVIFDVNGATTVTVIDQNGSYIGGCIMPGVKTSLEALARTSALLPNVELDAPQKVISSNTRDCMKAGIVYGFAGAIDGIIERYLEALGDEQAMIVATGASAQEIIPFCKHSIRIDDELLHKGLFQIWKKNCR